MKKDRNNNSYGIFFKTQKRGSFDNTNHPKLTSATLLQSNNRVICRGITSVTLNRQDIDKSATSQKRCSRDKSAKVSHLESFSA